MRIASLATTTQGHIFGLLEELLKVHEFAPLG